MHAWSEMYAARDPSSIDRFPLRLEATDGEFSPRRPNLPRLDTNTPSKSSSGLIPEPPSPPPVQPVHVKSSAPPRQIRKGTTMFGSGRDTVSTPITEIEEDNRVETLIPQMHANGGSIPTQNVESEVPVSQKRVREEDEEVQQHARAEPGRVTTSQSISWEAFANTVSPAKRDAQKIGLTRYRAVIFLQRSRNCFNAIALAAVRYSWITIHCGGIPGFTMCHRS